MKSIHYIYQITWGTFNHSYKLPFERFKDMLEYPSSTVFIAIQQTNSSSSSSPSLSKHGDHGNDEEEQSSILGFTVTYLIRNGSLDDPKNQHLKGGLAILQIHPSLTSQTSSDISSKISISLHQESIKYLESKIIPSLSLSKPKPEIGSIILGSVFPRFFPGIPWKEGDKVSEITKQYFEKLGWEFSNELNYDMYRTLPGVLEGREGREGLEKLEKDLNGLMDKAKSHGITYGPFNGDMKGLHELQQEFLGATVCHTLNPSIDINHIHLYLFLESPREGEYRVKNPEAEIIILGLARYNNEII